MLEGINSTLTQNGCQIILGTTDYWRWRFYWRLHAGSWLVINTSEAGNGRPVRWR
jgi:hypothetical protein